MLRVVFNFYMYFVTAHSTPTLNFLYLLYYASRPRVYTVRINILNLITRLKLISPEICIFSKKLAVIHTSIYSCKQVITALY